MSIPVRGGAAAAVVLLMLAAPLQADPPDYAISAHVLAAGAAPMRSACYRLRSVVAEPAAGFSAAAGGDYAISAGFLARTSAAADDLFFDGFEDCTP